MNPFGPVLSYDLIRMARRGRTILWLRSLYGVGLLGLLSILYWRHPLGRMSGTAPPQMLAAFAESFFYLFMLSQFVVVLLLTPAYVGDAIAEEKERRTLDYLLTTHLTDREIVLGKLTSRLAYVLLFILTGLPILSLTQLFGGVSPELLWSGFAATLLTLLSVSGISLLQSLYAKRSRNAILLTYLIMLCYFVLVAAGEYISHVVLSPPAPMPFVGPAPAGATVWTAKGPVVIRPPPRPAPTPPPPAKEWLDWGLDGLRAGNPIAAYGTVSDHVRRGGTYGEILPDVLLRYSVFHGIVFLVSAGWVMLRLRRVLGSPGRAARRRRRMPKTQPASVAAGWGPFEQKSCDYRRAEVVKYRADRPSVGGVGIFLGAMLAIGSLIPLITFVFYFYAVGLFHSGETGRLLALVALPPFSLGFIALALWNRRRLRASIGNAPMIWKEVYAEGGFRMGWMSKALITLLALGCLTPGVLIHFGQHSGWNMLSSEANVYVRMVGTLVGCIGLIAIGVRAAGSVSIERDKQTWDNLLTTPLTNREILFGKWLGSLCSGRWLLALLAVVWFLGFIGEGLSILSPLLLLVCLGVYGAFMAGLGLLFGIVAKSSVRAVMGTIFAALVTGGVPWICHYMLWEGDPVWSVPSVLALLGTSAMFVSSPLLAVGIWIKKTFRSIRGLTAAVYLMCSFPLVGYFVVLGLLERGSEYTFRTWSQNVINGITPPAVLADTAFFFEGYNPRGNLWPGSGSWDYDSYGRGLRVLCRALGLTAYAFVAALLWVVAQSRFLQSCGRIEGHARAKFEIRNSQSPTSPNIKIRNPDPVRDPVA